MIVTREDIYGEINYQVVDLQNLIFSLIFYGESRSQVYMVTGEDECDHDHHNFTPMKSLKPKYFKIFPIIHSESPTLVDIDICMYSSVHSAIELYLQFYTFIIRKY